VNEVVESGDLESGKTNIFPPSRCPLPDLSITAVDIADWSSVVQKLSNAIKSTSVASSKACPAPLFPPTEGNGDLECEFKIIFKKADILGLTDEELRSLLYPASPPKSRHAASTGAEIEGTAKREETMLVTLMFTLNELFATSIPKTVAFLLRMTDLLQPGTVLLVVDSPGSYSTITLGGKNTTFPQPKSPPMSPPPVPGLDSVGNTMPSSVTPVSQPLRPAEVEPASQRKYPMRFLLDHTLLSVAAGQWERILSEDSRWFRRDSERLRYEIGEGIRLEDMRFQVHVYRRLAS
jgi:25S rRNA (uracil2843-N3)-methyltransferase